jgi:hypothetical protein
MKKLLLIAFCFSTVKLTSQTIVIDKYMAGAFPIADTKTSILYDNKDDSLIQIAATLFGNDIEMVTGKKPSISSSLSSAKNIIVVGTIQQSAFIRQLIKEKKIDADKLQNKWEAYQIQVVKAPFKGVDQALVIAGSDRRGAAYGVLELSKQIGVSPWYWWADVPVKKKAAIYIKASAFLSDAPKVKYRGIFINDEAPAFSGWTREKFGGVNHLVYEKMFELILRLKGNYLWPAMWGNAFNDDDKLNPVLASKWGIVMGTSHHEPMLRAQQEWKRYGKGAWDYTKNDTALRAFWKKGIENMGNHESIVTIGMRGDGDMPMTQGTATTLLEKIVADQRKIIEDVTHKPASATPQLWALYKEVQDYYDKGMRVPDDVTLLLCDDNWGNIRKLPKVTDKHRTGGYGIYYHFDYVGGPRNYKWINTNNISRVWEQMHLAYEYGVDKIWIVNVGDLKPMEFPISFFLDYAWDTKKWNESNIRTYYANWAKDQFGEKYSDQIAEILRRYSQYSSRRKPELLDANTYSLTNYNEAERVLNEWKQLETDADKVDQLLPNEYKDAYFQLVLHPVKAFTNLYELYNAVAKNKWYASQNNVEANRWADKAKQYYINDSLLSVKYNNEIANGKWSHMMDQTHIGYVSWQEPRKNTMPALTYINRDSVKATNAVSIETNKQNSSLDKNESYISIDATHYTKAIGSQNIKWRVIPDIGKDGSAITTFPVTANASLSATSPHLEYNFSVADTGKAKINLYFSPTLNFHNLPNGLQFAVSFDDEQPQLISLNKEDNTGVWNSWVANNIIIKTAETTIRKPGSHILKYWMISPAVVLQKLVIDLGGLKPSYLGPPETKTK